MRMCVCVCFQCMWRLARWNIRLTAIIHVYHCSAPHILLFVPSSWASFHSVWSTAKPCSVLLLTNQTSQCHWAALSKTHGHVSSLHSQAFQRLAGSQAIELWFKESKVSAQPDYWEMKKQEVKKDKVLLEYIITMKVCIVFILLIMNSNKGKCKYSIKYVKVQVVYIFVYIFSQHSTVIFGIEGGLFVYVCVWASVSLLQSTAGWQWVHIFP